MKRIIPLVISAVLIFLLASCSTCKSNGTCSSEKRDPPASERGFDPDAANSENR